MPPAALTTLFRYDAVGNLIVVRNARGVEAQLEVSRSVLREIGADQALSLLELLDQLRELPYQDRFWTQRGNPSFRQWQERGGPAPEVARPATDVPFTPIAPPESLGARRFTRVVDTAWRRTSYSSLSATSAAHAPSTVAGTWMPPTTKKR